MSTSEIPMAEAKSVKILQRHTETPEGVAFLTASLDPFHDHQIENLRGVTDSVQGNSNILTMNFDLPNITQSQFPLAAGQPSWDLRVSVDPILVSLMSDSSGVASGTFQDGAAGASVLKVSNSTSVTWGTVNLAGVASGSGFLAQDTLSISPFTEANCPNGEMRVIGLAVEIIDATNVLNQQGSLTVYRMDTMPHETDAQLQVYGVVNGSYNGSLYNYWHYNSHPVSLAEAVAIPTTVTYSAKEGVLMCAVHNDPFNIPKRKMQYSKVFRSPFFPQSERPAMITYCTVPTGGPTVPGATTLRADFLPFGAIFSGLHPSASLRLRCRLIVEHFPTQQDKVLVAMAQPSANLDELALRSYQEVARRTSPGVPSAHNFSGAFWKSVLHGIEDYGPKVANVLKMIPIPQVSAAGSAIDLATQGVKATHKAVNSIAKAAKPALKRQPSGLLAKGLAKVNVAKK